MSRGADSEIRIALPSKGRMEGETMDFLADCGLRVNKTNPRQYSARIPQLPNVQVLFQRARDLARSVDSGDIDLAITGYATEIDALGEDHANVVVIHEGLGYGQCALVLAVPNTWTHVNSLTDLAEHAQTTGGLRVASKHTGAARGFLKKHGVEGVDVVSADGALEAAPAIGYADFIADITSTGTTLRENQLKTIEGGTIVESEAVLLGNRAALEQRDDLVQVTIQLLEFIEAHLRARGQYLVFANIRGDSAEAIGRLIFEQTDIGGLQGPTISPVVNARGESGWWAINIVVPSERMYEAIGQIRSIGGSGVIVTPARYIFEERPARISRLLEAVGREVAL
ncbi:MAG: ATP phosphoribosyltransferase [Anaerolineae bacterium]